MNRKCSTFYGQKCSIDATTKSICVASAAVTEKLETSPKRTALEVRPAWGALKAFLSRLFQCLPWALVDAPRFILTELPSAQPIQE